MIKLNTRVAAACGAILMVASLAACKPKGPAEQAGENIDRATEKAGQQIEKAGDKLQDSAKGDGK
jgi:predicted small lipoprotein YifL